MREKFYCPKCGKLQWLAFSGDDQLKPCVNCGYPTLAWLLPKLGFELPIKEVCFMLHTKNYQENLKRFEK